jgi:hypothetical protein
MGNTVPSVDCRKTRQFGNERARAALKSLLRCGCSRMPKTGWTPSIVPNGDDENVYLVVDDLGRNGRAYREADVENTDLETVIVDLLEGQYKSPVRVVAFNAAQKWLQDVSADVAHELRQRCDLQLRHVPFFLLDFVGQYEGRYQSATAADPVSMSWGDAIMGCAHRGGPVRRASRFLLRHRIFSVWYARRLSKHALEPAPSATESVTPGER